MYRQVKEPVPEIPLREASKNSAGVRRTIAGLRLGCLPLAVEVGRYTGTSYTERVCRLYGTRKVEDQHHFLINCPSLSHIRQKLRIHALQLNTYVIFTRYFFNKCKFLLCNTDDTAMFLIYEMYQLRQSVLYNQQHPLTLRKVSANTTSYNDLCNPCTQITHQLVTSKPTLAE